MNDLEISPEVIEEFKQHRKLAKKPLTPRALDRQMKIALRAFEVSMTPDELIEFTIDRGWIGINIEYTRAWLNRQMIAVQEVRSTRQTSLKQELEDTSWAN